MALASHASKILLWIILERIRVKTKKEIADEQAAISVFWIQAGNVVLSLIVTEYNNISHTAT